MDLHVSSWIYPVFYILCCLGSVFGFSARGGTPDGSEEWGYIPLRPGASMFYWFYRTTHPDGHLSRPVVLWLQGGPGLSGTGLGNFLEIGPLDKNLELRNSSWLESVNLLFIDCPAGVGFSIVANGSEFSNNTDDTAFDMIEMLQVFMGEHPDLQTAPFYIFGQSYGATMAAVFGYYLNEVIQAGGIKCNLKGIAMGNGCLSMIEPFLTWPDMLYEMSLLDVEGYEEMKKITQQLEDEIKEIQDTNTTEHLRSLRRLEGKLMQTHFKNAPCVSIYNIFDVAPVGHFQAEYDSQMYSLCAGYKTIYSENISSLMNGPIREKLGIIPDDLVWRMKNISVMLAQISSYDLYKEKWHFVDKLLTHSDLDIVVYQGQLDLICNTAATISWMQKLTWPGLQEYNSAERKTLVNPETQIPEMFVKSHENLKMFWILNSGHVVPADVPDVALRMLNRIIDQVD